MNLDNLKTFAEQTVNSSPDFQRVEKDIQIAKAEGQLKDVSLNLSDVVEEQKKVVEREMDTATTEPSTAPYTVDNNSFEKEQLRVSNNLEEMNTQWIKFLQKDPYLRAAFNVLLLMIK